MSAKAKTSRRHCLAAGVAILFLFAPEVFLLIVLTVLFASPFLVASIFLVSRMLVAQEALQSEKADVMNSTVNLGSVQARTEDLAVVRFGAKPNDDADFAGQFTDGSRYTVKFVHRHGIGGEG